MPGVLFDDGDDVAVLLGAESAPRPIPVATAPPTATAAASPTSKTTLFQAKKPQKPTPPPTSTAVVSPAPVEERDVAPAPTRKRPAEPLVDTSSNRPTEPGHGAPVLRTKGGDGVAKLALLGFGLPAVAVVNTGAEHCTLPKATRLQRLEPSQVQCSATPPAATRHRPASPDSPGQTPGAQPTSTAVASPAAQHEPRPTQAASVAPVPEKKPPVVATLPQRTQPKIDDFFARFRKPA